VVAKTLGLVFCLL